MYIYIYIYGDTKMSFFVGLAYQGNKDIVFRFIIEYSSFIYFGIVKYSSFHNSSSFALRYFFIVNGKATI